MPYQMVQHGKAPKLLLIKLNKSHQIVGKIFIKLKFDFGGALECSGALVVPAVEDGNHCSTLYYSNYKVFMTNDTFHLVF